MGFLRNFFIGILFASLSSCQSESIVSIHVNVKDDTGKAVNDASIHLNGTEIGYSDTNGFFSINIALKKGEHRLEVLKDSVDSKYVPFQQNFMYYRDKDSKVNADAILYTTPKWSYQTDDDFPLYEKEKKEETPSPPQKEVTAPQKTQAPPKLLGQAENLVSSGNPTEAIKLLQKIPATNPSYVEATQKIGEIYLTILNKPQKALETYDHLTKLQDIKNYDKPKYLSIYVNKAIAYFHIAELSSSENKKESERLFRNTLWITKKASQLLKDPKDFEEVSELVYYYKALSTHRLWLLNHDSKLAANAKKEWTQYQEIAKRSKSKEHINFLANSEVYLKQIKL